MAIELSLDTVDQLAQQDYADIEIPLPSGGAVTLIHPLRMEDEQRDKLSDYFKELQKAEEAGADEGAESESEEGEKSDADMIEQAQALLRIIVAERADDLFAALGRDATKYQTVVKFYFETVQPGEA